MTGNRVAIKAIDTAKYTKLASSNFITEVDAMHLCKKSQYVVSLVDSFEVDDLTYIVSKYAEGGNLLEYCCEQSN